MRVCRRFLAGIPHEGVGHPCVPHPSATPSSSEEKEDVRLACVRHAASVYPEPGSNSPSIMFSHPTCMRNAPQVESRFVRWVSRDPGQAVAVLDTLHLAVRRFALASPRRRTQASLFDRNCCGRLRVSPVAVLLSTLQLSRFMIERLFRSFQSTQALLHILGIVSSIYLSNITTFTKTPVACYLRQNDLLWVISDQSTQ
jgi:hypothetical protein